MNEAICKHGTVLDGRLCPQCTEEAMGPAYRNQAFAVATKKAKSISAHSEAAADMLQRVFTKLYEGTPPEELGREVQLIGIMMERRI